jgi:23S rRNA pseudouridine1911/1915/1917 synthase
MDEYVVSVLPEEKGRRLDLFIMGFFEGQNLVTSRNFVQNLIHSAKVSANGISITKPHYKVKENEEIRIQFEEKKPNELQSEDIPIKVVYEDDDLAVIYKECGMVVHPAPGNYQHTLVNAIMARFKKLSSINPQRPGIVHRLDKETSGLLVIAKNNAAHLALSRQFANHTIKRKYIALVKGKVKFDEDIIELSIGRHPTKRKLMSVSAKKTKFAKTSYRTLKRMDNFSLLELVPYTGRTHQLRVHLSFLGHPILGDTKYGKNNEFLRLALHAKSIGFIHPSSKKFVEFDSQTPKEFMEFFPKATGKARNGSDSG